MTDLRSAEPALLVETLPIAWGELMPLGCELALAPGDLLWDEDDGGDTVAVLLEGRLEVFYGSLDEPVSLRHVYGGAIVAEASAEGHARLTRLHALEPSRVLIIERARFREFLHARPELLEQLFWLQVRRARSLPWRSSRPHTVNDPLTGLYDEVFFRERLVVELERAQLTGDTVVVALFEIDRFDSYEAAHGHAAGEEVLRKIAEILKKTGRRGDLAARYAEREFATLLYAATVSDGWRLAEAFRGAVMATGFPGEPGRPPVRVTVSGGVAGYPQDAQDEMRLLEVASERRQAAQNAGGNATVGLEARTT